MAYPLTNRCRLRQGGRPAAAAARAGAWSAALAGAGDINAARHRGAFPGQILSNTQTLPENSNHRGRRTGWCGRPQRCSPLRYAPFVLLFCRSSLFHRSSRRGVGLRFHRSSQRRSAVPALECRRSGAACPRSLLTAAALVHASEAFVATLEQEKERLHVRPGRAC